MADQPTENASRRVSVLQLWSGWALPAAGWGLHLLVSHAVVEWYCNSTPDLTSDGVQWLLRGITVVAAVMALLGTLLAWRTMRRTGANSATTPEGRELQGFMGICGVFLGVLFLAIILVQGIPSLVLEPCQ